MGIYIGIGSLLSAILVTYIILYTTHQKNLLRMIDEEVRYRVRR